MKLFKKSIIRGCESRGDSDKPYLIRWTIIECNAFKLCIHKFLRSDADVMHDHPWNFWTFIVRRGYIEETPSERYEDSCSSTGELKHKRIKPFSFLWRPATHRHRVILMDNKPAWTIVLMGKYVRQWGFWTTKGWQIWNKYFKENGC